MIAPDLQTIAASICDDEEWTVWWKVLGILQ
jgi:hypothetical protein